MQPVQCMKSETFKKELSLKSFSELNQDICVNDEDGSFVGVCHPSGLEVVDNATLTEANILIPETDVNNEDGIVDRCPVVVLGNMSCCKVRLALMCRDLKCRSTLFSAC